jgi:GntR family transcriptional regulator/MocR family aminotransferase
VDPDRLAGILLRNNVKIHALSRYYIGPQTRAGLIFGYGAVGISEITRGLSVLRKVLACMP